jgi:hypothetical protein
MTLTIALCDACPSTEVDELTMALLNIFDSRGLGFVLLEELIKHEVDDTGMYSTLDLTNPAETPEKTKQNCFAKIASLRRCYLSLQSGRVQPTSSQRCKQSWNA